MLSNFASRKSDKDGIPASANGQAMPQSQQRRNVQPPPQRTSAPHAGERHQTSVIGPDLTIQGNLTSNGEVQVDGEVQGDVYASHVVIGENARINGGIMAQEIVVRGHVTGFVRGHKVMLQATSHVEGDVLHKSLAIEQGAYFEGKSRRSEDPLQEQGATSDEAPQRAAQPQQDQQASAPHPQASASVGRTSAQTATTTPPPQPRAQ